MSKIAPKILIIEWFDPHEDGDTWEDFEEGKERGIVAVTVGTLLEETDIHYLVAFNRAEDGTYMRKGFIPKTHIRRMRELKYPWKSIGSKIGVKREVKGERGQSVRDSESGRGPKEDSDGEG